MSDQYIGEIRMFGGNFAPKGWAFCNGQLMAISQNTALFSILGVTYGGDGKTTFALPDLQGRAPMHQGNGPGLTPRMLGQQGGVSSVTLSTAEMPSHNHPADAVMANGAAGQGPEGATWASGWTSRGSTPIPASTFAADTSVAMSAQALGTRGGSQPHNNMQPYLGVSFIIALEGEFPPRS